MGNCRVGISVSGRSFAYVCFFFLSMENGAARALI